MAITWTDVSNLCGADMANVPGPSQTAILAWVDVQLDPVELDNVRDLAAIYLAGHMATLELRSALGPGGPLSSERVGPLSAGFAVPVLEDPWWATTSFGIEFVRVMRQNVNRFGFVV